MKLNESKKQLGHRRRNSVGERTDSESVELSRRFCPRHQLSTRERKKRQSVDLASQVKDHGQFTSDDDKLVLRHDMCLGFLASSSSI